MKKGKLLSVVFGGVLFSTATAAFAFHSECSVDAKAAMDTSFGLTADGTKATSDITRCLSVRDGIKVAVNVSSNALNAKSSAAQQINNVKNMVENYEGMYGLTSGHNGYRIAVVIHGSAGKFALDGAVYDAKFGTTGGNAPTINVINFLLSKGVRVYMCQNTMRSNGYVTSDLIPGIEEVPAGVTAVTDFGMMGWVVLSP